MFTPTLASTAAIGQTCRHGDRVMILSLSNLVVFVVDMSLAVRPFNEEHQRLNSASDQR